MYGSFVVKAGGIRYYENNLMIVADTSIDQDLGSLFIELDDKRQINLQKVIAGYKVTTFSVVDLNQLALFVK